MTHHQDPGVPDPPRPETAAEGIARLDQDKVAHHTDPDNPLLTSADSLTTAVNKLSREVHARSVGFLVALVLITALGIAVTVIGYRSEHFLTCQIQQNTEFRHAAATERAAQRRLFNIILNPASTQADRLKATQDYYAGLIATDQHRTDVGGC